jgi:predicted nucleic acid-binding protein
MTILDTDYLVALLRGDAAAVAQADKIKSPKTTVINAFELYYGADRSRNPKKSHPEVNSLLKSMDILEFEMPAVLASAKIQAELMNAGNPVNILDVLIAGIVMVNNEELLTRNVNHFNRINGLNWEKW